jgi:hypothetical protein
MSALPIPLLFAVGRLRLGLVEVEAAWRRRDRVSGSWQTRIETAQEACGAGWHGFVSANGG